MEKDYSKDDIIKLAEDVGDLLHRDYSTLQSRLNNTIEFLHEERVQEVLEGKVNGNDGNYFYNEEMNLTKAKYSKAFEGYDFNLIDAIFLASLTCLFNQSLMKKIRNGSNINEVEAEEQEWVDSFTSLLPKFESIWESKGDGRSWQTICLNIESLLYRFTLLKDMTAYANEPEEKLQEVLHRFRPLSNQDKVRFYDKVMKSRIDYILGKLEAFIADMEENDPESYIQYKFNRNIQEIDNRFK
ncbi:hypothetical protein [Sporosarcina sp. P33]|uniref:hypothetical protein n=1 Tax=Sporosarcina sp. P33 TaxID=1930764 RepID=UPI0009BD65B6|nr:hypothetical protein [Sporosarcina sp. P33]ARD48839.1 hypothetical protein SporoP33_11795 [Sporosarcina sp. P33]